ncbi:hypothetical protein [Paraburkholderia haematera]|jgi:hypothetical protein|uniref:Uncharacterized protein n=1 Tax=Paraburkholderia haematera TaxID=2793077 RepID=A0ABM8QJQ1_9BURK|nr:hypothetical protein [Paraburkholderia haematera]CAE6700438.1 hypothetical protein R69888_00713 [Paraburkholderia haematera]
MREDVDAFLDTLSGPSPVIWLTWLTFLGSLDPDRELGFSLAKSKRWQKLKQHAERLRDNARQHAPLHALNYRRLGRSGKVTLNGTVRP